MVVTTALIVKSFRVIVKNTEATDREAITMLVVVFPQAPFRVTNVPGHNPLITHPRDFNYSYL